jgi:hypothetical protein
LHEILAIKEKKFKGKTKDFMMKEQKKRKKTEKMHDLQK